MVLKYFYWIPYGEYVEDDTPLGNLLNRQGVKGSSIGSVYSSGRRLDCTYSGLICLAVL
jgi:hypothetical protein